MVVTAVFLSESYEYHTFTSKLPLIVTLPLLPFTPLNEWFITQQPRTVFGISSGVNVKELLLVFLAFPMTALVTISYQH